eukprot:PhM_4_TR16648/c0_g2_i1/m.12898/K14692/SLC30A5_7, ZNT5_7, MTP, MSC2; solute carrier family 30 (zinc transporter), member 5/7
MHGTPALRAVGVVARVFAAFQAYNMLMTTNLPILILSFLVAITALVAQLIVARRITHLRPSFSMLRKRTQLGYVAGHALWYCLTSLTFYVVLLKLHPLRLMVGEYAEVGVTMLWMSLVAPVGTVIPSGVRAVSLVFFVGLAMLSMANNLYNYAANDVTGRMDAVGGTSLLLVYLSMEVVRKRYRLKVGRELNSDATVQAGTLAVASFILFPFVFAYCSFVPELLDSAVEAYPWIVVNTLCGVTVPYIVDSVGKQTEARGGGGRDIRGVSLVSGTIPSNVVTRQNITFLAAYILHLAYHTHYRRVHGHQSAAPPDEAAPVEAVAEPHFFFHFDNIVILASFTVFSFGVRGTMSKINAMHEDRSGTEFDALLNPLDASEAGGDATMSTKQKKLTFFLVLNLCFMFVELIYGIHTNSLGLVSDSFHMLLDSASIGIGLYAAHMATWKSNNIFTYGYGRYEILSGFTNGVLLVLIALFVFLESVGRILDPPEVDSEWLFLVSAAGCGINVIGAVFFHEAHAHHGHSHSHGGHGHSHGPAKKKASDESHGHSHDHGHSHSHGDAGCSGGHDHDDEHHDEHNECASHTDHNMRGVYIHILVDLLGSIGVMTSTLIVKYTGYMVADPICSTIISGMILLSSGPLLKETGALLMQRMPSEGIPAVKKLLRDMQHKEGVIKCTDVHLWQHATSPEPVSVCTLHVHVQPHIKEDDIRAFVRQRAERHGVCTHGYLAIQIVKKPGDATAVPPNASCSGGSHDPTTGQQDHHHGHGHSHGGGQATCNGHAHETAINLRS